MKYDIIYADPPWHYAQRRTGTVFGGGVTDKYPTMSVDQIAAVPVIDWVNDDAMLFMWTTMPYLDRSFKIIESWGFRYVTVAFTWIKTNPQSGTVFAGVGNYTKSNAELCLLGRRGAGLPREHRDVPQVIMSPRREHSRKPDETRDRIVRLFGDRPRLEMFARTTVTGWDVWGNETGKF